MVSPSPILEHRMKNTIDLLITTGDRYIVDEYAIAYPQDYIDTDNYYYWMDTKPWEVKNDFNIQISPESVYTNSDKLLVIAVDFPDKPAQVSIDKIRDRIFGTSGNTLINFYKENSYSKYIPDGQVVGWYRLANNYAYYKGNGSQMASDALDKAKNDINVNDLDVDNNGKIERLLIIHAGAEGAWTGDSNDIWAYTRVSGFSHIINGKTFTKFCTTSEFMASQSNPQRCGVDAHEYGHILEMPDLYDTTKKSMGAGLWTLMASGSWGGDPAYKQNPDSPTSSGTWPTSFDPWCKNKLGWLTPSDNQSNQLTLKNIEDCNQQQCAVLRYTTNNSKKYFLIENRQKILFDSYMPGSGILIWRINEDKINGYKGNDDPSCYGVGVLQADNKKDLENNTNKGDDGDPYPGSTNNRSWGNNTHPSSIICPTNDYLDILIDSISDSSLEMTLKCTLGTTGCNIPILAFGLN